MRWPCRAVLTSLGLLALRVGFGLFMVGHGYPKLQTLLAGEYDKFPDPLNIGNRASLMGAVAAELLCSLLVIVGAATRIATVPLIFTMAVAAFVVHAQDPWLLGGGRSKEPALLYLFAFVTLLLTGPGRYSVDHLVTESRKDRAPAVESGPGTPRT